MIEISNLTKAYGKKKALDNISFNVKKGEILGFLGPNGAGKSTTMNILTGYISSTSGSVKVDGFDILEDPYEVKKRIGYLPEIPPLYTDMTVWEYLDFVYDLKKAEKENKKEHINKIISMVRIEDMKGRKIANLSKGYRQRVGLAQALIGDPEVLILDEPTVGLDPSQIIEIRNVIKEFGRERTVIFSSHILSEISAVCERVIIINNGRLVAEDTPKKLTEKYSEGKKLSITVDGKREDIEAVIGEFDGIKSGRFIENNSDGLCEFEIEMHDKINSDMRKRMFMTFARREMPIHSLNEVSATLEGIFIKLTGGAGNISENKKTEEEVSDESNNKA
ncbi:MAG: ATP-binding cassette domain-containing protein [Oscillospiraceae bacterium]|nr:ATP-binding cassette domain-containing protein [Oscillospiraceae bacterium]